MEVKGRELTQKLTFEEISQLNERKRELREEHAAYMADHPELKTIMSDFMSSVLLEKPDDVFSFAREHFTVSLPTKKKSNPNKGLRPLVLGGPPGIGKTTLINMLCKAFPKSFGFCTSHTSREAKPGEEDGKDYHFTSKEDIQAGIDAGKFVEFSVKHGVFFATSEASVQSVAEAGRVCIMDIDLEGVRQVKRSELRPHFVFISPPSMEVYEERLRARESETEDTIRQRLHAAEQEMSYAAVEGNFELVIVNEFLDETYDDLVEHLKKLYPNVKD